LSEKRKLTKNYLQPNEKLQASGRIVVEAGQRRRIDGATSFRGKFGGFKSKSFVASRILKQAASSKMNCQSNLFENRPAFYLCGRTEIGAIVFVPDRMTVSNWE
jgi:hypothetical protein